VLFTKNNYNDEVKEGEMGGTSSMHGRKKECITKVQLENQKE
jgi:hypothetical protein